MNEGLGWFDALHAFYWKWFWDEFASKSIIPWTINSGIWLASAPCPQSTRFALPARGKNWIMLTDQYKLAASTKANISARLPQVRCRLSRAAFLICATLKIKIIRIWTHALSLVQCVQRVHVLLWKFKVENLSICGDTIRVVWFGNRNHFMLQIPA